MSTTIGEYITEHQDQIVRHHITTCRVTTACGHCYFDGTPTDILASMLQYLTIKSASRNRNNPEIIEIKVN